MTRSIKVVLWFLSLALSASARKAFRDGVRVGLGCSDGAQGLCSIGGKWVANEGHQIFETETKDQCKTRKGGKRCTMGDLCELVTEDEFGVLTTDSECLDAQIKNKGIDAASWKCLGYNKPCCAPKNGGSECVTMKELPNTFAKIKKDKEDKLAAETKAANLAIQQKTDICCLVKTDKDFADANEDWTYTYKVMKLATELGATPCGVNMGETVYSNPGNNRPTYMTRVSMQECGREGESCMGPYLGQSQSGHKCLADSETDDDYDVGPGCKTGYIKIVTSRGKLFFQCGDASAAEDASQGERGLIEMCVDTERECISSAPDE